MLKTVTVGWMKGIQKPRLKEMMIYQMRSHHSLSRTTLLTIDFCMFSNDKNAKISKFSKFHLFFRAPPSKTFHNFSFLLFYRNSTEYFTLDQDP